MALPPRRSENPSPEEGEQRLTSYLSSLNEGDVPPTPASLLEDDEEEAAARKGRERGKVYHDGSLTQRIEENYRRLRKDYDASGIKSSRFITTDILLDAPASFLGQYEQAVKEGVEHVRSSLSRTGRSESISKAVNDPTNDVLQDEAYRTVHAEALTFMEGRSYRNTERIIIISLICNEVIGFGPLDPLWRDPKVDEIICNGPHDIQVEVGGKLHRVTGTRFRDRDHLNSLVERLYGAINKTVSRINPIVDGRLHDNSRMAVVHESVCPEGPNFTIRRHKDEYILPKKIIDWQAASPELMTYLGNLLYKGCSVLVIGRTGSGKTTLLGALSGFFREDHRVLTLEDNLELKLAPHKLAAAPMETLPGRADQNGAGGVTMRDLVKASLRQRPNALVVGEVRDEAAFDLCQALNTGHYGMSTVHANNEHDAIYRLVSMISQGGLMGGNAILPLIAASFDLIVRVEGFPYDGSRKVVSVSEVAAYPEKNSSGELTLPLTQLWTFVDEGLRNGRVAGHWTQVGEMSSIRREFRRLDLEEDLTWEELQRIAEPPTHRQSTK